MERIFFIASLQFSSSRVRLISKTWMSKTDVKEYDPYKIHFFLDFSILDKKITIHCQTSFFIENTISFCCKHILIGKQIFSHHQFFKLSRYFSDRALKFKTDSRGWSNLWQKKDCLFIVYILCQKQQAGCLAMSLNWKSNNT